MQVKVKKQDISCVLCSILIFHLMVVKISSSYFSGYVKIREIALFLLILFLVNKYKVFLSRKYLKINVCVMLFAGTVMLSAFLNRGTGRGYLGSFLFAGGTLVTFLLFEYFNHIEKVELALTMIYRCTLFYCVITDVLFFLDPMTYGDGNSYLIGNKFTVSYLHIIALVLYYARHEAKNKKQKWGLLGHLVFAICISILTECSTAIIGCIVLMLFYIWKHSFIKVAKKPVTAILAIGIFNSILIFNSAITSSPLVRYVIVNLLGESETLTGRLDVYMQLTKILFVKPWFGFGLENNYSASMKYVMAANTQNGILDCVVSYGIIGTILFILILVLSIRYGAHQKPLKAFHMIVYMFIVLSIVEITFNQQFLFLLALLAFGSDEQLYNRSSTLKTKLEA